MAGHSKRANIKHRKSRVDAQKSQYYAKVGKVIQIAARQWADPSMNPSLATALLKAKQYNLPKEVVQRAIEKGSGTGEWSNLTEIWYEWYAPWWIALYIKCITDNTNRSSASIKTLLNKYGGAIGEPWSVARQFVEQWEIFIWGVLTISQNKGKTVEQVSPYVTDTLEEQLMECDIEDYEILEEWCRVITARVNLITVTTQIEKLWYQIESSELVYNATSKIELDETGREKLENVIEIVESDDDVDSVYHNAV